MPITRDGTLDDVIWDTVHLEYPTLPTTFAPGEIMLDIGCHTGALSALAARRGATVVGYEANRENYALAQINLAPHSSVTLHHAAIWRSDVAGPTDVLFTPSSNNANTGGGSVLYSSREDHWIARPRNAASDTAPPDAALSTHRVDAVPLDDVLIDIGPVRFMKMDVEGSEFPILLTCTRLDLVAALAGEYHELTEDAMARLAPEARIGSERYSPELLGRRLEAAGFEVSVVPDRDGRGYFTAQRR